MAKIGDEEQKTAAEDAKISKVLQVNTSKISVRPKNLVRKTLRLTLSGLNKRTWQRYRMENLLKLPLLATE